MVADSVAGIDHILVRGIFTPRLTNLAQPSLNFRPPRFQKWPDNRSLFTFQNRKNSSKPFRPCSAKQFQQNSLGLVIKSMCGRHRIQLALPEEFIKPCIAQVACGLFDALSGLLRPLWSIYIVSQKTDPQILRQALCKRRISIRFSAANTMMHMKR